MLKASRMNPITWMNLVAYQNKKICICIVLHCPFAFINKTVGCHHSSKFHFKEMKKFSNSFIVGNKLNTLIRCLFYLMPLSHFHFPIVLFFEILSIFTLSLTYCWNYASRLYFSSIVLDRETGKRIINFKL